jgi:hypothetical protein
MPPEIRDRLRADRRAARAALRAGDVDTAWRLLEDAHVLSQPWAVAHVGVHRDMLRTAMAQRDGAEARGQVLRLLVGGPGSLLGRYPVGNTGRAHVPATAPMPVRPELAAILARAGRETS